ncbi:MAG: MSCRAMM family protein, partial [Planctomycetota bacterium]
MLRKRRSRSRKHLYGALALLLLLAAMLPLGAFLAGILSGGGHKADEQVPVDRTAEASTLKITVLNALDRSPIEGARILVRGLTGGETDAESDPDGHATVEGLGAGPVQVEASWRGSGVTTWTDPSLVKEILLAVPPASPRGGQVRAEDGSPFEGAAVHLLDSDGELLASTRTDAEGRYELPDDPAAESVCVELEAGAPAVARNGDVIVREGALLKGRLLGTGEGGELRIYGMLPSPGDDGTLPFRALWKVGKGGEFEGRLPEGAHAWGLYEGLPIRIETG